jgi:hypothetical protein
MDVMANSRNKARLLSFLLASSFLVAACNAPATPEQGVNAAANIENAYRVVQDDDSDSILTIERDGAEVWRIESFLVSAGAIADLTGDGRANVLIHEAATLSDRALHLLDLPPEGEVSVLWTLSGHASSFHYVESQVYERIEAGESLAQAPDAAHGDDDGLDEHAFDPETLDALASAGDDPASNSPAIYVLEQTGPDLRLAVSLNGRVIWQSDHTVIGHHGPAEPDAEGAAHLLVHEAVSRSERRLQVLSLEGETVRSVWSQQGMASEMSGRFERVAAALDAGAFDPAAFDVPGAASAAPLPAFDVPAPMAAGIAPNEAGAADTPALEAAIAAMGYAILTGEDAEAQDMTIAVMQHGDRVWGVRAMMLSHYSLSPSDAEGAVDLLVEIRNTRRSGTDYRLRLAPDGLTVISETPGAVTGIQSPRDPRQE